MPEKIDHYAVFGNPIKHSKSPLIHRLFAEQTGQSLIYTAILADIGQFEVTVKNFLQQGGKGLNITVPFKENAWKLADQLSERAQRAGAVNTLKRLDDGTLFGDTTDGTGLVRDMLQNHNISIKHKTILIIGAGGAVRGIIESLLQQQPEKILIANRTSSKASQLANDFSDLGNIRGCGLDETGHNTFDIIINGTSASLHGDLPDLPDSIFHKYSCSYDMMYATEPTVFMQWSSDNHAEKVIDGLGMLVEQAAESFYLWRGVKAETRAVIKAVRETL